MATQHSPSGMTAMQQIDSRPLTKNQKNLIGLAVAGNISEFFDMFLIGFAVASLLKDPNWNLTGGEAGIILAMSGLGTMIGAIMWGRLADKIGRRGSFFWCVLLFTLFHNWRQRPLIIRRLCHYRRTGIHVIQHGLQNIRRHS